MIKSPLLLKASEHAGLRVAETSDWRFAADQMLIPIAYNEMADVAREYPLVFLKGQPRAYTLTGIEQGVNAFISSDGTWLANYVPAYLRCYPFGLTPVPGKEGEFAIVIDSEATQLMSPTGKLLFESGQPSAFLTKRLDLLKALQRAERITQELVTAIQEAGLLKDQDLKVQRPNGNASIVRGLQIVDENKLNSLPVEEFAKLRNIGALPLIYSHLISLANFRNGILTGRHGPSVKEVNSLEHLLLNDKISFF